MLSRFAIAAALLAIAGSSFGDDSVVWQAEPFTADAKALVAAVSALKATDGADVELLLQSAHYQIDAERSTLSRQHWIMEVRSEAGKEAWSTFAQFWVPWREEKPAIRARVISSKGSARELDPSTIEDFSPPEYAATGRDLRIVRAPLPTVKVGSIIEIEIQRKEHRPFSPSGTIHTFLLSDMSRMHKLRVTVEWPDQLQVKQSLFNSSLKVQASEEKGWKRLRIEGENLPADGPLESHQPMDRPRRPEFRFTTGTSWQMIAAEYSKIIDQQIAAGDVEESAAQIVGTRTDRDAIIAKLLDAVRRSVEPLSASFGDSPIVPVSPSKVLALGRGDGKDFAVLLTALLRAKGIASHVALVRSSPLEDVVPELPALNPFDKALVYVPGESPLWIDPIAHVLPAGRLLHVHCNRRSLIIASETRELTVTPAVRSKDSFDYDRRVFQLGWAGEASVAHVRQLMDPFTRARLLVTPVATERATWEDYCKSTYPGSKFGDFEIRNLTDLNKPVELRFSAHGLTLGSFNDDRGTITVSALNFLTNNFPPFFAVGDDSTPSMFEPRIAPVQLPMPFTAQVTYRILAPFGFAPSELPDRKSYRIGAFRMAMDSKLEGKAVVLRYALDTGEGRLTAQETNEFREALLGFGKDGPLADWIFELTFHNEVRLGFAEGRGREVLMTARQATLDRPKDGRRAMNYAQALSLAGFGEPARQAARLAIDLLPSAPSMHGQLGGILRSDAVGRDLRAGFDREGARLAYRQGIRLSNNEQARAGLLYHYAWLMLFDSEGNRYTEGSSLKDAVMVFKRLPAFFGPSIHDEQAAAMFFQKQYQEVARRVAGPDESDRARGFRLAARAMLGDSQAAVRTSTSGLTVERRRTVLLNAAEALNDARHYPQAIALYELAADASNPACPTRSVLPTLRRLKRLEEIAYEEGDPRKGIQDLLIAGIARGKQREAIDSLFYSPPVSGGLTMQWLAAFERLWTDGIHKKLTQGWNPQRAADIVSIFSLEHEGDDRTGYRISISGGGPASYLYTRARDGRYPIWDPGKNYGEFGREALRRIDEQNIEGARTILQWASEGLQAPPATNPFTGLPFVRIWKNVDHGKPAELRSAAATLAIYCEKADPSHLAHIKNSVESADSTYLRVQYQRAYVHGLEQAKQFDALLLELERLFEQYPDAAEMLSLKAVALRETGKLDKLQAIASQRLEKSPGDPWALLRLSDVAEQRGEFAKAIEHLAVNPKVRDARVVHLKRLALGAFLDPLPTDAVAESESYRARYPTAGAAELQVLAVIFARAGSPEDALQLLRTCIDQRGKIENADNVTLGLIAESYELPEIARDYYTKVEAPSVQVKTSSHALAQWRLKQLPTAESIE